MKYLLRNCRTGEQAVYPTWLEVLEEEQQFRFCFSAEHSASYCPYTGYNENHYEGDVCEVFLQVAPGRYYEMELTPEGGLFLALITYLGTDEAGTPQLQTEFVPQADCFVTTRTQKLPGGYRAEIAVPKAVLGDNPLRFNAFRIETDGGESEKHLFALNPTKMSRFHVPEAFVNLSTYC